MREEIGVMSRLAFSTVLTSLAFFLMITVDVLMMGRVGAAGLAAVATGAAYATTVTVLGHSTLVPISAMVARARGAGEIEEAGEVFRSGCWVVVLVSIPTCLLMWDATPLIRLLLGVSPRAAGDSEGLVQAAAAYCHALSFSLPFIYAHSLCHFFLMGMQRMRFVVVNALAANLINAGANWVLIYGKLGAPAMGSTGCAWATTCSRVMMAAGLVLFIASQRELRQVIGRQGWTRFDRPRVAQILTVGWPPAVRQTLEVGVNTMVVFALSRLGSGVIAGQQIAANVIGLVMMIPLGLGAAASVRVGFHWGGQSPLGMRRATLLAGGLAFAAVLVIGGGIGAFPERLAALYTHDPPAAAVATAVLAVIPVFLLFRSLPFVLQGALQGVLDTKFPAALAIVCDWLLGIPLGLLLAFRADLGAPGMYLGLAGGSAVRGAILIARLRSRFR
jgi:MATE family multidrug resistance protein